MKKIVLIIIITLIFNTNYSQLIINGSFENNLVQGTDQINLTNDALNALLPNVNAFGSYGDVDIIQSSIYGGGGAQDKKWYLGITGGGTDIVALTLSINVTKGKIYSFSFYDRKHSAHPANPIQIGLSQKNNVFGTVIYTSPEVPTDNVWTQRTFTFTAPHDGEFITVQMPGGSINEWANIDDFVMNDTKCGSVLTITTSALSINEGESVTLTADGANEYKWTYGSIETEIKGKVITDRPIESTVYKVTSQQKGCGVLTATLEVKVNKPKTDTATIHEIKMKDSVIVINSPLKFNRHRLNHRKLNIQETVFVNEGIIKILVWDKNRMDGDMISLYLNGQLLEENLTVSKTKKEISIHLQPGSNLIVMQAINLGRVPPNTAAISLSSNIRKIITLVSDLKKSGTIEVIYTNDAITSKN